LKILSKYVLKEHAGPLVFALAALTSLLLLNYVAKHFGQLVGKGLPWTAIAEFFALSVPFTVAMTLPMAVLISTLYAFSRLAAENEITALKASGVGMTKIMRPVLLAASVVAVLMIGFNDQILSRSNHQLAVLQTDIARTKPTFALREQVINPVSPGKLYVRANKIDRATNRMREITIYDLGDPSRGRTIFAQSGTLGFSANRQDLVMTLFDGNMQEVSSADPGQLQRLFFTRNRMLVKGIGSKFESSTDVDYKGPREKTICEMQQDYAMSETSAQRARQEFAELLVNATRAATTGDNEASRAASSGMRVAAPGLDSVLAQPAKLPVTLGGAYCRMLSLFDVKKAKADPAPQQSTPAAAAAQERASRTQIVRDRAAIERQRAAQQQAVQAPSTQTTTTQTTATQTPATPTPAPVTVARPPMSMPPGGYAPSSGMGGGSSIIESVKSRLTEAERNRDLYLVEIHKKFALAVACVVFVLIGAPIALRFPRGGVGLVISVSLGVFALYYVGLIAGQSLAEHGTLNPFWSMWMANILFGFVGLLLLSRMGKEQGSSRSGGDMKEMLETLRIWFAGWLRRFGFKVDRRRRVA
jgi:lipopolysaccharide export system permease protein